MCVDSIVCFSDYNLLWGKRLQMQENRVSHVVRVCDATYSKAPLTAAGIDVHDWAFPDGASPPSEIIDSWLDLVRAYLRVIPPLPHTEPLHEQVPNACKGDKSVGIHCVAGV